MNQMMHNHHQRHHYLFDHDSGSFVLGRIVMIVLMALALWLLMNWVGH